MTLTTEQRLHRLRVRTDELAFWRDRAYVSLDEWSFNGEPLALGAPWPKLEGVSFFEHLEVQVPDEWPVGETRLDLDLGGEGLIVIAYKDGGQESFGLDPYHGRYPLKGAAFSVSCEAVARLPLGVPNRGARLARAAIVWPDAALERLERTFTLVGDAARVLEPGEIVPSLLDCAERAFASIEWPTDTPEYLARSAQSREMLEIWEPPPDLEAHPAGLTDLQRTALIGAADRLDDDLGELRSRYPEVGEVALTGHAHLDLAWLWPLDETRRKARRTYHTAV
ncbi:MAG: alpha-mannosidase, partial [Actinomycetota bacterium]|nr:alpha-mannosidase [Actinomycetota bacterium]